MNTYRPLGEIVRACLDLDADDPPEVMAERLGGRDDLRPLLGLAPEAELQPWEAKARLTQAWIAFLEEMTQDGPVASSSRTSTGPRIRCSSCWPSPRERRADRCCCSLPRGRS